MSKLPPKLINLTPVQRRFQFDNHRFITLPAGRRSRKTLIGKWKILHYALENPGEKLFEGAPTNDQAKSIFWDDLKSWTHYLRVPGRHGINESDLWVKLKNGSYIRVVGLDKPARIEGRPWNGCLITECGDIRPETWSNHVLPALSDTNGFAILEGVPEGLDWFYDICLKAAGGALPEGRDGGVYAENRDEKHWIYYHWYSSDVLTTEQIEIMKQNMDERTFRQEAMASFEAYGGKAYYNFGEWNLKKVDYDDKEFVHIGMDFNVNPMTATLSHVRGDEICQFGEIYMGHSNTPQMIEEILSYTDDWNDTGKPIKKEQIVIYPDSTGRSMTSNATQSDIALLEKAGFKIMAKAANPRQKDRIASINTRFKSTAGDVRYWVDPRCKMTVRDFNNVERENDGRIKKNKETDSVGLTHISDAAGYKTHYLFPFRRGAFTEV